MRYLIAFAAPIALAAAACSSGGDAGADSDSDGAISGEEMAAEAANVRLRPGQWESTMRFTEFDMPEMPEEMRAMMREQIGRPQTSSNCITPEQAANPEAEMFNQEDSCEYSEFRMSGGEMLIEATCQGGDMPGIATMRMEGSYTPTTYDMSMQMDMEGAPSGPMHFAGEISARRTGECSQTAD